MKTFIKSVYVLSFLLVIAFNSFSQYAEKEDINRFVSKYKEAVSSSNSLVSDKIIIPKSKSGNSYDFAILSYIISANNTMFEATKDFYYLKKNQELINNIKNSASTKQAGRSVWIAKVKPNQSNYSMNNKEFRLFEGYLFRYIAEYFYILAKTDKNLLNKNGINPNPSFAENNFLKWYKKSNSSYGDDSMMQEIRTHMGSLWAMTALYLFKTSTNAKNKIIYHNVFSRFNKALKNNMQLVNVGDNERCYDWNSTWNEKFTKSLKKRQASVTEEEIQDVTHGNMVIQFIFSSYKMGLNGWTKNDLQYFANTVKFKIWDQKTNSFSDNVDGSSSRDKTLQKTGWKQSDGWMKLMLIDPSLYTIYKNYYDANSDFIDKTTLSLQFYANFLQFYSSK